MGRVKRGFDFLGYHFKPHGISLTTQTLANFASKALRLYEQEPPNSRVRRLGEYLRRWQGWVVSGGLAGAMAVRLLPQTFFAASHRQSNEASAHWYLPGKASTSWWP